MNIGPSNKRVASLQHCGVASRLGRSHTTRSHGRSHTTRAHGRSHTTRPHGRSHTTRPHGSLLVLALKMNMKYYINTILGFFLD